MKPLEWLDGYKTIIAGLGLIGLGVYQASQGDYAAALQSVAAGLAALGLRRAITKADVKVDDIRFLQR